MQWNKGYTAQFYAAEVDTDTWHDKDVIQIISGSISRGTDGLRESADVTCRNFDANTEKWIRIYLNAKQGGNIVHTPIFTGLAVSPEENIDGNIRDYPVQCYSVLQPAEDVLLERGWYAPVGINGAELVKRLLSVSPAPVKIVDESKGLTKAIVAEDEETNLSMANKILKVIERRLRILGDGTIEICKVATEPSAQFDVYNNDSVEPKVNKKRDWFKCPNVFKAIQGNMTAIARDDDPNSILSTVKRGREVWKQETVSSLNTGEGISAYARRRLKEEQSAGISISYNRRYKPNLLIGDVVRMDFPLQGIVGNYRIKSQSIELSHNARTSEEVSSV